MKFISVFLLCILSHCTNHRSMENVQTAIHVIRLKPGQDLLKEIDHFVRTNKVEAGWIVTCVGSLTQTNLRFANQPNGTIANGHFEIVSLTGTISIHGSHLHLSASDSMGRTSGGHLLDQNLVYTTAEIVIGESKDLVFSREKDGSTEWKELQIRKKQ